MTVVEDGYLSRVIACGQITSRVTQPVCILLGGLLAAATSVRTAVLVCGLIVAASSVLLPWRRASWQVIDQNDRRDAAGVGG